MAASGQYARIEQAHSRIGEVEKRVSVLETDGAVADERFTNLNAKLDSILTTISRLNWIVITGLVGGVVAWVIGGGLNVGP